MADPLSSPEAEAPGVPAMAAERQRRILIVDDDERSAGFCRGVLEGYGYSAIAVADGEAAMESALVEPCDLMLLDLVLPGMDGLTLLSRLREDVMTRSIPVVVVTGVTDREPLTKAFEIGVDDYLIKPYVISELLVRIKSVLRKRELEEQLIRSNMDLRRALQNLQQKEAHLIQSAKLAAIGTLAAGVAHELNQPLMVVRGTVQMMLQDMPRSDRCRDDLRGIELQTGRMMRIINHLTDFSRQANQERKPVDVNGVIKDAFTFVGQQLTNHTVSVKMELADALPPVPANRTQIEQVFLNILLNARDALHGRRDALLSVRTEYVTDPARIRTALDRLSVKREQISARGYVVATFTDNGAGISPENIGRIFDPFFTTKPPGKGTGLGLSVSYNIVQEHGGWIRAESKIAEGTSFSVYLPVGSS